MSTSLIVGGGGQDGYYIGRLLLERGDRVVVAVRPSGNLGRWPDMFHDVEVVELDVTEASECQRVLSVFEAERIFHLAGFSSVGASWSNPGLAISTNASGTLNLLESLRQMTVPGGWAPHFVHASSGEIFAGSGVHSHDEASRLSPVSPYGAGKATAKQWVDHFREWYGVNARSAILFSHESPLRPPQFLSRRISDQVAAMSNGDLRSIELATLTPQRDWGFAGDYADAMVRMADYPEPEDFVLATGAARSVADWVRVAMGLIGIKDWRSRVTEDPSKGRPTDPPVLVGDATKAEQLLQWKPTVPFEDLVALMLEDSMRKLTIPRV